MAVQLESVTFTSGDGETIVPSYLATPDGRGPHPVVLILRGVAGPDDGYTEIARRLAEWGYAALVHGWKVRGTDPTDGPVYADLQGAMGFLGSRGEVDLARLAVFGFCRGGVHALMAARAHPEIRAIAVFHGFAFRPAGAQPGAEPYDLAEGVSVPMLVLHGTEDERAPILDMRRMEARMRGLGKACAFVFYEGARHGFAVRTHPGYAADAAARSFDEAKRFLATHLPVGERAPMNGAQLVGGTEADRRRLLERLDAYLDANARFDWEKLQDIWSGAPEAVFFNLNGHTYRGREHWTRLWQYYRDNVRSGYWSPTDVGGVVSGDLAVLWCHRRTSSQWVGTSPPQASRRYGVEFTSRSTMVFRKEAGDWRVVHVHFSPASDEPRPGGV